MAYVKDNDLEFLKYIESDDLNTLVDLLIYDKNGKKRFSEQITSSDLYQTYRPDHNKYWELIAEEIQLFGGNSITNILRFGKGVQYREILQDVCKKMKYKFNKYQTTEEIEQGLLFQVLAEMVGSMSVDERTKMLESLEIPEDIRKSYMTGTTKLTPQVTMIILQTAIKQSGFFFYKMSVVVVNAILKALIGRGLSLAGNALLTRSIAVFAGPVGWAISGIWLAADIASPAFRVTIPAVFEIARLRALHNNHIKRLNY